jgi:hypothetical protein
VEIAEDSEGEEDEGEEQRDDGNNGG